MCNLKELNRLDKKGGRSGSFIFSTFDKKFVIKTITQQEKLIFLNELLEDYTDRILAQNSVLVRVFGVFMLQSIGNYSVNLMIMEDISDGLKSSSFKMDLKGSTLNRKIGKQRDNATVFMKDIDFLAQVNKFDLEESEKFRFIGALEKDIAMLTRHHIMDYSVFGAYYEDVHFQSPNKYRFFKKGSTKEFYCLGLIDFLQKYSFEKQCEYCCKRIFFRAEASAISSVDPEAYATRMLKFCQDVF